MIARRTKWPTSAGIEKTKREREREREREKEKKSQVFARDCNQVYYTERQAGIFALLSRLAFSPAHFYRVRSNNERATRIATCPRQLVDFREYHTLF